MGEVPSIPQGEGGEQRDPLMRLLFCLCQHSALSAVVAFLREGERLFAYLERVLGTWSANQTGWEQSTTSSVSICGTNAESPSTQARPRCGTKVAPTHPIAPDCSARQRTSLQKQWCGEVTPSCTLINRDSRCLQFLLDTQGTSSGFLRRRSRTTVSLDRIPVHDTQSWLFLSFCAATRSNFFLRAVNPSERSVIIVYLKGAAGTARWKRGDDCSLWVERGYRPGCAGEEPDDHKRTPSFARRKFVENQNTMLALSDRIQELQNEVNCMKHSKDFQDDGHTVDHPTFPVNQRSHLIAILAGC